jgi:hypothetical protein
VGSAPAGAGAGDATRSRLNGHGRSIGRCGRHVGDVGVGRVRISGLRRCSTDPIGAPARIPSGARPCSVRPPGAPAGSGRIARALLASARTSEERRHHRHFPPLPVHSWTYGDAMKRAQSNLRENRGRRFRSLFYDYGELLTVMHGFQLHLSGTLAVV